MIPYSQKYSFTRQLLVRRWFVLVAEKVAIPGHTEHVGTVGCLPGDLSVTKVFTDILLGRVVTDMGNIEWYGYGYGSGFFTYLTGKFIVTGGGRSVW